MSLPKTLPLRIYYEDTDAGGVVYHANYLNFFERARTEYLRDCGVEQDGLLAQGVAFVVTAVQIDYKIAARFNQLLTIETDIVESRRASMLFAQRLLDDSGRVYAQAQITVACVELTRMRPRAVPEFVVEALTGASGS